MRRCWIAITLGAAFGLVAWQRYGARLDNEARYRSDQLMLGFLRATSEFESESPS